MWQRPGNLLLIVVAGDFVHFYVKQTLKQWLFFSFFMQQIFFMQEIFIFWILLPGRKTLYPGVLRTIYTWYFSNAYTRVCNINPRYGTNSVHASSSRVANALRKKR